MSPYPTHPPTHLPIPPTALSPNLTRPWLPGLDLLAKPNPQPWTGHLSPTAQNAGFLDRWPSSRVDYKSTTDLTGLQVD